MPLQLQGGQMQVSCRGGEESPERRREREGGKLEGKKAEIFGRKEGDGDECFGSVFFL